MLGHNLGPRRYSGARTPFRPAYPSRWGESRRRHSAADTGTGVLSRREAEVTALVAQGLMDKEIAQLLTLSRRTVEQHVASALRKTSCRSRTQLAVRYVGSGGDHA
jgi:DNA-binding NarL/FixJ family response regulator